jgi:hypothetical protein
MEIEEIKEKLKSGQIEFEYLDYRKIINSCKEIDCEQVGNKKWYSIRNKGNDLKYGTLKICLDTMEWRGRSFNEFYEGCVVD